MFYILYFLNFIFYDKDWSFIKSTNWKWMRLNPQGLKVENEIILFFVLLAQWRLLKHWRELGEDQIQWEPRPDIQWCNGKYPDSFLCSFLSDIRYLSNLKDVLESLNRHRPSWWSDEYQLRPARHGQFGPCPASAPS